MLRDIADDFLLNNSRIGDFGVSIYIVELDIKDTTDTGRCASYLHLYLKIYNKGTSPQVMERSLLCIGM
jgi:hypothetical protein